MEIQLKKGRLIGDNHPAYITAEIGINHNGQIEIAKKLIDQASLIGIDAVKFQKRTIDELYRKEYLKTPYIKDSSFGKTYGEHKHFLEFSDEQLFELKQYTEARNLDFIVSGFDFPGFDFIENKLDVAFHKVASPLVTHIPLLKHVASYGKPVVLSTGMHTFNEVRSAVETIKKINKKLIVLQCTTSYPTENKDVNLLTIKRFRNELDVLSGYSSHDRGVVIPAASVLYGSCFIEKHFTLDRTMKGPDHVSSVEPRGLELIKSYARVLEEAIGTEQKAILDTEIEARKKYGYSCVAKTEIKAGTVLTEDLLTYKLPGNGIRPKDIYKYLGKKIIKDKEPDQIIKKDDIQ